MIHLERLKALEKLGLTREEALEWLDMLAQKEHKSWDEVVKQHAAIVYKTKCIVCYQDENGKFSYHRYVDTARIHQIYGFQFSPNWLIALKDQMGNYGFTAKLDMKQVMDVDTHRHANTGWQVLTKDAMDEYKECYSQFIKSSDSALFLKLGIIPFGMQQAFPYWTLDEEHNKYTLCYPSGRSVRKTETLGYVRLVQLVCNHFEVTD